MDYKTLQERQAWTLPQKIDHSLGVIEAFASWFEGRVFVSFSGGKDSVVMLTLCELVLPQVKAVFINTGCESPSVCRFIREQQQHHDIDIIRPRKTLKQVFADYGFPLVSKEISHDIHAIRLNPYSDFARRKLWLANRQCIPERWHYLLNEPYQVSDNCCRWLKKMPSEDYIKQTNTYPYIGILASESRLRTMNYVKRGGCNTFEVPDHSHPASWPLAIWTDDDVWRFIRDRRLPLPDIYDRGATRTGCMGCGFGVHRNGTALTALRHLYPRWYEAIMRYENNGTPYREALRRMLAVVGRTLPDEGQQELMFDGFSQGPTHADSP